MRNGWIWFWEGARGRETCSILQGSREEVRVYPLAEDLLGLSEAFACEAEDDGLVDEPVDGGDGLGFGGEEGVPVVEAGVGGEEV